ncbi:MAG: glycosyltransferase family 1 protein [Sphingobium sp.]
MRIAIVTDAWAPQVNGVVRTLCALRDELTAMGNQVKIISPDQFASLPCPTYPEIRLAFARSRTLGRMIADFMPDAVHLATEGPLCLSTRRWCLRNDLAFSTAYHTQFPEYLAQRSGLPASWFWRYIRWFHGPAQAVLVSTRTVRQQLRMHGLQQVRRWGRGVDLTTFTPDAPPPPRFANLPRPIQLYVGRIAIEKNIEAFLSSTYPGTKIVVGDGPARPAMEQAYPNAIFLGALLGRDLAGAYANADIFVFPSRTDTFGLVMIEAMACGTPVAAYPVTGPLDVVTSASGALAECLDTAIAMGLTRDRAECAAHGRSFSWATSAREFLAGLHPLRAGERARMM